MYSYMVMAYVVMAYVVMAFVVMALNILAPYSPYIVMAYTVMARRRRCALPGMCALVLTRNNTRLPLYQKMTALLFDGMSL